MEIKIGNLDDFRTWLIVHSTTELESGEMDKILATNKGKETWDVRLTINGFELPLDKTIDLIEKNLDKHIEEKARELISSRLEEIENQVNDFSGEVEDKIVEMRNAMTELFDNALTRISPAKIQKQ